MHIRYNDRCFLSALLLAGALLLSCSKEVEVEVVGKQDPDPTPEVLTYTLSVVAEKGEAGTRALSLDGNTLNATWAEGEEVRVYKDNVLLGTLAAQMSYWMFTGCSMLRSLKLKPRPKLIMIRWLLTSWSRVSPALVAISADAAILSAYSSS